MNLHLTVSLCSRCYRRLAGSIAGYHSTSHGHRLVEVGKLEQPQDNGYYQAGQFFLHRVFSYRGVLLYPWTARVFDRDIYNGQKTEEKKEQSWEEEKVVYDQIKSLRPELKPYYISLIDTRDIPYVRTLPEAVTVLADSNNSSLYTLPGLDYVSHDDVIPYTNTCKEPFTHELFGQFLIPSGETQGPVFIPREVLKVWRETSYQWLNLSEVHRETTHEVKVTVIPFYMGWKDTTKGKTYIWRYNIRIENMSREQFQLKERHWKICNGSGDQQTVKGAGVVGEEPIFSVAQPSFQYSSYVSLRSPTGHMWGMFRMKRMDKTYFEVRIPPFCLESQKG